jgi:hypothetical protein
MAVPGTISLSNVSIGPDASAGVCGQDATLA